MSAGEIAQKITASHGISIALTVVLVSVTWNLKGEFQEFRNEIDERYVSQKVADVRFKSIEDRLDDIYFEIRELRRLQVEGTLETSR